MVNNYYTPDGSASYEAAQAGTYYIAIAIKYDCYAGEITEVPFTVTVTPAA